MSTEKNKAIIFQAIEAERKEGPQAVFALIGEIERRILFSLR